MRSMRRLSSTSTSDQLWPVALRAPMSALYVEAYQSTPTAPRASTAIVNTMSPTPRGATASARAATEATAPAGTATPAEAQTSAEAAGRTPREHRDHLDLARPVLAGDAH